MPLRHPAPMRSRTHIAEFQSRNLRGSIITPIAILILVSLLIAEALGVQQENYGLFALIFIIAFLILLPTYRFLRSPYFS